MRSWLRAKPWLVYPFSPIGWRYHVIYRAYREGSWHPTEHRWLSGGESKSRLASVWAAICFPHLHYDAFFENDMVDGPARVLTTDEVREAFIDHVWTLIDYWDRQVHETRSQRDRLSGLAHSLLATIDGCDHLPAFVLAPDPHPGDREDAISEGSDYYPAAADEPTNIAGGLHELLYERRRER